MAQANNSFPDFVIFLDAEWYEQSKKNRQHFLVAELARQLEDRSKILGIERPICPWTSPFRKREEFIQWLKGKRGLRQASPNLFIYTPFVLVHNLIAARVPGLTTLNRCLMRHLLKRVFRQLNLKTGNLIAWIHHPFQLEDIGVVGEKLLVYDCYDAYQNAVNGWQRSDLLHREDVILKQADLVITASEKLFENVRGKANRVHIVPNGVDLELFTLSVQCSTQIPVEMNSLPRPIIGFLGKIAAWLDFELLSKLAMAHPKWTFAFVGPFDSPRVLVNCPGYLAFSQASNVHILGPRPHTVVPSYMKAFDVCIIPYLLEGQVLFSSPLKLYEYLAMGKPIVSVDIPHVAFFQPLVRIGNTSKDFDQALITCLTEENAFLHAQRRKIANNHSWRQRVIQLLGLIDSALVENSL